MGERFGRLLLGLVAFALASFGGAAHAATRTWTTGSNGSWGTAGNWSGSAVPSAGDAVVFDTADGNCTINTNVPKLTSITINSGYAGTLAPDTQSSRSLVLTGAYAQNCTSCTVNAPGGMSVGGAFSVSGGNFNVNAGTIAARGNFTVNGGNFDNGSGRLLVNQVFTFSSGNFYSSSGTTWLRSGANRSHSFGNVAFQNVYFADATGPGTTGLVGYWKFDDSLTPSDDASGNAYHLAWKNSPGAGSGTAAPLIFTNGNYIHLDLSTADYLEYDSGSTLSTTSLEPAGKNWTLATWFAPTGLDTSGAEIASAGDDYFLRILTDNTVNLFMRRSTSGWEQCTATNTINTSDGGWHFVAGSNDGSNLTIYLDGVKTTCAYSGFTQSYSGRYFRGGHNGNTSTSYDFDGDLDDLRVYNRALSDNEVWALFAGGGTSSGAVTHTAAQGLAADNAVTVDSGTLTLSDVLYVNGTLTINGTLNPAASKTIFAKNITVGGSGSFTPSAAAGTVIYGATADSTIGQTSFNNLRIETVSEPNLVAYWKLDEGANTQTYDWSGNGNNGTRVGTTWKTTSLASGIAFNNTAAVTFNGTSDYVSYEAYNHNPITVSAWIYRTGDGSSTFPRVVVFPYFRFYLTTVVSGSTGGVGFLQDCSGTDGNWQSSGTTYSYNAWHHIAATYDGLLTTNNPKLYIDGVSVTVSKQTTPSTTCVGAEGSDSGVGYLGVGSITGTLANYFAGSIDDVRVYNTPLSDAQIAALAAGGYSGAATPSTFTLGGNTTVNAMLGVDAGKLATSSYTLTAANTDATQVASVTTGSLVVGSAATSWKGGLTVNGPGTLTMNTTGGSVAIGSGKTLTMNGTLDSSNSAATTTIKSVSGNYTFTVGSTATSTPTLNINGMNVQNTDANGMNIDSVAGSVTTFTRFDKLAFSSSSTTSGATQLQIKSNSLYLASNGCSFDMTGMTGSYSNVKLTGNGTADGETRANFGSATCKNTSGSTVACETLDSDDDSGADGVGDTTASNAAVVQFIYEAYSDTAGNIEGFPTAAFNWSTFAYWKTYVAFNSYSGSTNRLLARDIDGADASYYWDIPSGNGTFKGAPRWGMEGATHYVYVVTSLGYVYKLSDSGSAFAIAANWPYNNGASATATSPLTLDSSNIYWAGLDSASARKFFSLAYTGASPSLNATRTISADIIGAPAVASISGTLFLFGATNGKIYKMPQNVASDTNTTQTTSNVSGRVTVWSGGLYFGEDIGKIWDLDSSTLATIWSYQDTTSSGHTCSSSSNCTVKSIYFDIGYLRAAYGDQDGHVYLVARSGSTANGAAVSGYPIRPTGASTSDSITVAPVVVGGVAVFGTSTGKVFIIDQQNASSAPAQIAMYHFGSAVSSIAYDFRSSTTGQYMIGTNDGHLYLIDRVTDPTPNNN